MIIQFKEAFNCNLEQALAEAGELNPYLKRMQKIFLGKKYDTPESSVNLAFDTDLRNKVKEMVTKKVFPELKYVFVVGIGGSNLGTKAVYDALYGYRDIQNENRPRLVFVDTNNEPILRFYTEEIFPSLKSANELLIVTISKSGSTTETMANTEILLAAANKQWGNIKDRIVVITDEDSVLAKVSEEEGIAYLTIPKQIGGRYSALSAVGLFPLCALGVDIDALHEGARDIIKHCLDADFNHNPAVQSASVMTYQYKIGKTINDTFVFNSELESLGKWYRQLLGESIGKENDITGKQVFVGITPTVSIGSTDLHSVGQLYLGGPKDKFTTFVYGNYFKNSLVVPEKRTFPFIVEMINGKTIKDIMKAILQGVKIAYNKQSLPFMSVELEGITSYELGAFMQFKMIEMMYLGRLFNVNPFDQPNVEMYKIETKKILEAQ